RHRYAIEEWLLAAKHGKGRKILYLDVSDQGAVVLYVQPDEFRARVFCGEPVKRASKLHAGLAPGSAQADDEKFVLIRRIGHNTMIHLDKCSEARKSSPPSDLPRRTLPFWSRWCARGLTWCA